MFCIITSNWFKFAKEPLLKLTIWLLTKSNSRSEEGKVLSSILYSLFPANLTSCRFLFVLNVSCGMVLMRFPLKLKVVRYSRPVNDGST